MFLVVFFFQSKLFRKQSFRNTIRVSNSLDPDQARRYVGPDLDQNCLQRLSLISVDRSGRQRVTVKQYEYIVSMIYKINALKRIKNGCQVEDLAPTLKNSLICA